MPTDTHEANGVKKKGNEHATPKPNPEKQEKKNVDKPHGKDEHNARKRKEEKVEEPKVLEPTVNVKKDVNTAPQWSKGTPMSFADMVRAKQQKAQKPRQPTPPPAQPVEEPSEEEEIVQTVPLPVEVPVAPAVVTPPAARTPEPEPSAATVPVSFYVLEVERMDSVTLPANILQVPKETTAKYTFSAQPGVPPQTVFRTDTTNLGSRGWNIGATSSQPWQINPQQDVWAPANPGRPFNQPVQFGYTQQPSSVQRQPQQQYRQQQPLVHNNNNNRSNIGGGVW
ncbi:hypothetical protein ADEAN_000500600 [Angomonas deanei]|uniref:Uncharacterized protein n=1 Tax=Angomonas deanei TaxID=59799 RepID=A0A7G2CCI4_9TRYP|nr:hypothetical protein ADEAN_000500600 [Angomonas deanei]